ncbi:hypothetical protein T05_10567, partial [Trichinella murrelli]
MDGTFKIVPEWYQQLFTIHVFKESKFLSGSVRGCPSAANYHLRLRDCPYPCSAGTFPGVLVQDCYFHFCQVVRRKVADLGLRT